MSPVLRLAALALAFMGLTAAFLLTQGRGQRLGAPGLVLNLDPLASPESLAQRTNAILFPTRIIGYDAVIGTISEPELLNLPSDTGFGRVLYRDAIDGFEAQLSAVIMGTDRTSIHRPQQCLPWQGWAIADQKEVPVELRTDDGPRSFSVQRIDAKTQRVLQGRATDIHAVYVYWYVADGLVASTHASRHLQTIRSLLVHRTLPRWAYVSYFAVCAPDEHDATFRRLTHLMAATVPRFQIPGFQVPVAATDPTEGTSPGDP